MSPRLLFLLSAYPGLASDRDRHDAQLSLLSECVLREVINRMELA